MESRLSRRTDFLCNLLDLDADRIVDLLREQAGALTKPARSLEELVAGLAKTVPHFAAAVAKHLDR